MAGTREGALAPAIRLARGADLAPDGRPLVMGVLNITPDSFSDGGRFYDPERALDHALSMIEEGADVIDLGAESTRPGGGVYGGGASEVAPRDELERLLPVLERLREQTETPLSVDTRKAAVAREALAAGADMINDVSALGDDALAEVVAEADCPVVLMHSRGELSDMQKDIRFLDVLSEVRAELEAAVARARAAGIRRESIVVDPGIGFGKTARQNLQLLRGLPILGEMGLPLLVGASRKSFIGEASGAPPDRRLPGSLAALAWAARARAAIVRVHDVAESVQFLRLWDAIDRSEEVVG